MSRSWLHCRHTTRNMQSVTQFLPSRSLNPSDICCEISAVYDSECICKVQIKNWDTKLKMGLNKLTQLWPSGQAHKGYFALVSQSQDQRFFFLSGIQSLVHRCVTKQGSGKKTGCFSRTISKFYIICFFQLSFDSLMYKTQI